MFVDDPKDAKADPSPADTKQDADDESLDQKDDEKEPDGPLHKSDRWKEVYGKYKEYKGLGDPTDLQAKLARLEYYDDLVSKYEDDRTPKEPKTTEQKEAEEQLATARAALQKVAPEVDAIKPLANSMKAYFESVESGAEERTLELMEEAGMPTETKDIAAMVGILQPIIKEDRKLHLLYFRNPEKAVERAFERFSEQFTKGADRKRAAATQRDKERLSKLPKTPRSGGSSPAAERTGEPTNLKEAHERAKEFFKQFTG